MKQNLRVIILVQIQIHKSGYLSSIAYIFYEWPTFSRQTSTHLLEMPLTAKGTYV
jgi:hypothetical protein